MQHTIEILLPIFGFLVCGYGAGRFGLISDEGIKGIMTFILYFAIPALLFRIVVSNELPGLDDLSVLPAYFGGCVVVFTASVWVGRAVFKLPLDPWAWGGCIPIRCCWGCRWFLPRSAMMG